MLTITRPGASSAEELHLSDADFYSSSRASRRKGARRAAPAPAPAPAARYRNAVYIVDGKYTQFHNYHLFSRTFGKPDKVATDATATAQPVAMRSKDLDFLLPSRYRGCSHCKRQNLAACTCKSNARKLLRGLPMCNICVHFASVKGPEHCDRELLERRLGMLCTGCNASHARMWFSPEQLKRKCGCTGRWAHVPRCESIQTPLQRCITWERRVFKCAHSYFTWGEDLEQFIFLIAKANWEDQPFKNGFTFMECPNCLPEYDVPRVLRPGVRYGRDTNDDKHGRLELTWRLPLSAIKGNECDDMLCPHLTFSDGACSIRNGLWEDAHKGLIRCRSCGFRCFWTRKNRPGAETILRGRFVLWSSRTPKHLAPSRLWPLVSSPTQAGEMLLRQSVVCRNEEFHFPERGLRTIQPGTVPFNPPPVQAQAQPFPGGSRNLYCLQVVVDGTTTQGLVSGPQPESQAARSA